MRSIALLAGLLVAVLGGTAASAATHPSGTWALSAICAHEFASAADQGVGAEPVTDADAAAASDTAAPGAAAAVAATDVPAGVLAGPPVDAALDAAIRACASLEDWLSAAELFPEALGGADATAFLDARCSDPSSGLEPYAACHSVAAALATPAPVVEPDPTPEVVEPDIEIVEPVEPVKAAPDGGGKRDAASRDRRRPRPPASVTRDFRARIPAATEIRYFKIRADSPAGLLRQNQRRARAHCGDHHAIACVMMKWDVRAAEDHSSGRCTIARAVTTLSSTVFLPRWTNRGGASQDLVRWWRAVMHESAVHEAKHIQIQKRHLARFRRAARGKPCGSATILFNRHMARANRAQAEFDRVEYQKPLPPLPLSLLR